MTLHMPSRTRLAVLLSVMALALAAGGFLAVVPLDAGPAHGTHVEIFDCVTCQQIGHRYYNCDGVLEEYWGVQSSACMNTYTYGCIEN